MRRVILESRFAGATPELVVRNVEYARLAVRDSLLRGEAPLASHLLYTQEGVLDDDVPEERTHGIDAGHAWLDQAEAMVVYADHGISAGMQLAIDRAAKLGLVVETRYLAVGESV